MAYIIHATQHYHNGSASTYTVTNPADGKPMRFASKSAADAYIISRKANDGNAFHTLGKPIYTVMEENI